MIEGGDDGPTDVLARVLALENAMARAPTRDEVVRLCLELAQLRRQRLGDVEGALAALRRAVQVEPGHRLVLNRYAQLCAGAERWAELVDVLELSARAARDDDERARVLAHRGDVLGKKLGRIAEARGVYREVARLAQDPALGAAAREAVERIDLILDPQRGAAPRERTFVGRLRGSQEPPPSLSERPMVGDERVEQLLRAGRGAMEAGRLVDARAAIEQALAMRPRAEAALRLRHELLRAEGRWDELLRLLVAESEEAPSPSLAAARLGEAAELAAERLDDWVAATRALRRALAYPGQEEITVARAALLGVRRGHYAVARELRPDLEPDVRAGWLEQLASAASATGDGRAADAIRAVGFEDAVADVGFFQARVRVLEAAGDALGVEEALLRRMRRVTDPDERRAMAWELAASCEAQGRPRDAVAPLVELVVRAQSDDEVAEALVAIERLAGAAHDRALFVRGLEAASHRARGEVTRWLVMLARVLRDELLDAEGARAALARAARLGADVTEELALLGESLEATRVPPSVDDVTELDDPPVEGADPASPIAMRAARAPEEAARRVTEPPDDEVTRELEAPSFADEDSSGEALVVGVDDDDGVARAWAIGAAEVDPSWGEAVAPSGVEDIGGPRGGADEVAAARVAEPVEPDSAASSVPAPSAAELAANGADPGPVHEASADGEDRARVDEAEASAPAHDASGRASSSSSSTPLDDDDVTAHDPPQRDDAVATARAIDSGPGPVAAGPHAAEVDGFAREVPADAPPAQVTEYDASHPHGRAAQTEDAAASAQGGANVDVPTPADVRGGDVEPFSLSPMQDLLNAASPAIDEAQGVDGGALEGEGARGLASGAEGAPDVEPHDAGALPSGSARDVDAAAPILDGAPSPSHAEASEDRVVDGVGSRATSPPREAAVDMLRAVDEAVAPVGRAGSADDDAALAGIELRPDDPAAQAAIEERSTDGGGASALVSPAVSVRAVEAVGVADPGFDVSAGSSDLPVTGAGVVAAAGGPERTDEPPAAVEAVEASDGAESRSRAPSLSRARRSPHEITRELTPLPEALLHESSDLGAAVPEAPEETTTDGGRALPELDEITEATARRPGGLATDAPPPEPGTPELVAEQLPEELIPAALARRIEPLADALIAGAEVSAARWLAAGIHALSVSCVDVARSCLARGLDAARAEGSERAAVALVDAAWAELDGAGSRATWAPWARPEVRPPELSSWARAARRVAELDGHSGRALAVRAAEIARILGEVDPLPLEEAWLEVAAAADPTAAVGVSTLYERALERADTAAARRWIERALEARDEGTRWWLRAADLELRDGQPAAAAAALERSMLLAPLDVECARRLAELGVEAGQPGWLAAGLEGLLERYLWARNTGPATFVALVRCAVGGATPGDHLLAAVARERPGGAAPVDPALPEERRRLEQAFASGDVEALGRLLDPMSVDGRRRLLLVLSPPFLLADLP